MFFAVFCTKFDNCVSKSSYKIPYILSIISYKFFRKIFVQDFQKRLISSLQQHWNWLPTHPFFDSSITTYTRFRLLAEIFLKTYSLDFVYVFFDFSFLYYLFNIKIFWKQKGFLESNFSTRIFLKFLSVLSVVFL